MDNTKKILLIGEGGVGKTSWLSRQTTGEYIKQYIANTSAETHTLNFNNTNFIFYDIAGQNRFGQNFQIYNDINIAFIMFDVTSRQTLKTLEYWIDIIKSIDDNIPIVILGNKIESQDALGNSVINRKIKLLQEKYNNIVNYIQISCKSNYNYDKPLEYAINI